MKNKGIVRAIIIFPIILFLYVYVLHITTPDTNTINITAEQLWCEFKYNRDTARKLYDDKSICLSGVVAEPPTIFMDLPCLLLENGEDSIPDGIFCFFADGYDLSKYEVGQEVFITGRCNLAIHLAGDDTNPMICFHNCSFNF